MLQINPLDKRVINIQIHEQFRDHIDKERVRFIFQTILNHFQLDNIEATILFGDDAFIQGLNLQYRGVDSPTDVLSFDIDHMDPETGRRYLGDVIISVETAKPQASLHKVSLDDELSLLVVHGMLHLLGYDHSTQAEQTEMWRLQREILEQTGATPHLPSDQI